ncbi:AraC family transcriptional regulator [Flagellimonas sp. S3867]|uniref:helix-turn-helix domain-containing protein n=1 Tax=Flagellimonas sp. S3867 TaxID=2768063 RepID=UPI00168998AA|nr:AraC family transcriptional regulator [Flagellimonas sp. S3867]
MRPEIIVQEGNVNKFLGKKIDGKVYCSDLNKYKSLSFTQDYSFKMVIQGTEQYVIDGEKKTVEQGQFLLIPPEKELKTLVNDDSFAKGVCVYFSKDTFEERFTSEQGQKALVPSFPMSLQNLFSTQSINCPQEKLLTDSTDEYLEAVLDAASPFFVENSKRLWGIDAKKNSTKLQLWEKVEKGRTYIENNFNYKLSLAQIAMQACLSPFHFQKKFKTFYGKSPNQYVIELRIQKARKMISEGYAITDIAGYCGFEDVRYLKKCLRK